MTAKTFTLVLLLAVVVKSYGETPPFAGVDPNTLQCDPEGQVFLLLPHFTDCSKFYMCTHGEEVEFSCSGGLIFDFEEQTCNWKEATRCWLRTREESIEGSGEGSGSGDLEWLEQDQAVESAPAVRSHFATILDCSNARDAAQLMPFKGDCQRYWRCVDGLPVSAYCSDGLFFNAHSQQCDFEGNARCADNVDDELNGEFIVYQ